MLAQPIWVEFHALRNEHRDGSHRCLVGLLLFPWVAFMIVPGVVGRVRRGWSAMAMKDSGLR